LTTNVNRYIGRDALYIARLPIEAPQSCVRRT